MPGLVSMQLVVAGVRRRPRPALVPFTGLILAVLIGACSGSEAVSCSHSRPVSETHRYATLDGVDAELLSLDVHASPTAGSCPVVVWVHGGSWQAGDRRSGATEAKARYFVGQGYVFVSVNHRLVAEDNQVRWPDFGRDLADAVVWVIDNGERIGVDPTDVSLIGHSSGAHLVSIVATNPDLLEGRGHDRAALSCVVSLDSVTHDLTDPPPWEVDIIDLAFGDIDAKRDGSPTLQALDHPTADGPEVLIVTRGRQPRIDSANRLGDAITDGGGTARVADVSPYDHGEVSLQLGVADEAVITPLVEGFLAGCRGDRAG